MRRLAEWIDCHEPLAFVGAVIGGCVALALVVLFTGCGSTRTVYRPPNLGPPRAEAHDARAGATLHSYRPLHGNAEHATYYNASGCGVERWSVKTLTDPGANQVNFTPQDTWIGDLVSIAPPISPTDRVGPTETSTFRLSATLIYVKHESDGDLHLVLEDGQGNTMIVESTDPGCAQGSLVLRQMEEVRAAINVQFPSLPSGRIEPGIPVTVTGVGFFDRVHGQTGVARNGAELHPLTAIRFGGTQLVPRVRLAGARDTD